MPERGSPLTLRESQQRSDSPSTPMQGGSTPVTPGFHVQTHPSEKSRKRAYRPKVRTGCKTCKYRRVKCDEGKPECKRCTSTGRKCDGYEVVVGKTGELNGTGKSKDDESVEEMLICNRSPPEPELQLALQQISIRERRALDYFYHETAPQLSGFFSQSFWTGSLQQLALAEPALQHAIVALSTLHEDGASFFKSLTPSTAKNESVALTFYNRAINSILQKAKDGTGSLAVVSTAAIIFTCFEFLRGNVDAALTHIGSGVKLLKDWRSKNGQPHGFWGSRKYPTFEAAFIENEISPLISWLNLVASIFGYPAAEVFLSPAEDGVTFTPQEHFNSIAEARAGLVDITNASIKLTSSATAAKHMGKISTEAIIEQHKLSKVLEKWKADFEDMVARKEAVWTEMDRHAIDLIRATHVTTKLWLATCLSPYESSWDVFKDDFEYAVDIAERLINKTSTDQGPLSTRFSFELGVVPPLHITAWKCRWPHIRRRAARLLLTCPRRECLFDSTHFFTVFARIIEMEEESFGLGPGEIPAENQLPPEGDRVVHFHIAGPPTQEAAWCPRISWNNAHDITFLTKPNGVFGDWSSRTERVELGNIEFGTPVATHPQLVQYEVMQFCDPPGQQLRCAVHGNIPNSDPGSVTEVLAASSMISGIHCTCPRAQRRLVDPNTT